MKKLTVLLMSILAQSASMACLGRGSEDYILLNKLPIVAKDQAVVAKVQLIKLSSDNQSATVRVIDAIKGIKKDEAIKLITSGSSCSWLSEGKRFGSVVEIAKGMVEYTNFYIAGDFKENQGLKVFHGAWRGEKRVH